MSWVCRWRGILLAFALSVMGHAGVGFVWHTQAVSPMLLTPSSVAGHMLAQPVEVVRLVSSSTVTNSHLPPLTAQPMPAEPLGDSTPSQQEPDGLQMGAFVRSSKLDSPLVPMSAPDTSLLDGLHFSGHPIRVRIFVADSGRVVEVLTVNAAPEDDDAVAHIKAMFLDTAYIPGRMDGKPVAAQLDMELQLDYLN
jgi:hypothetical protein